MNFKVTRTARATLIAAVMSLSGCHSLGSSGPSASTVLKVARPEMASKSDIRIVDLSEPVAIRARAFLKVRQFSEALGDGAVYTNVIGKGDILEITIWESPPATLFNSSPSEPRQVAAISTARSSSLPQQMVDVSGYVKIPFAGPILALGRTPQEIEKDITSRLRGLAHDPQVVVRIAQNSSANVTIIGEVANSVRIPLTPKGERLLDVLANAGGVRQPIGKTTIQISRDGKVVAMPLDQIIRDSDQNIRMQAGDVVTALFQPYSFTALGAIGNNAEIPFEGNGLTLSQALGRIGGLRDERADVRGVFIFRQEDPTAIDPVIAAGARKTAEGKVPVIYRVNLRDPKSFFWAQNFPIRDKDVVYVSNAPAADLQKFVNIVSSVAFSVVGVANNL